MPPDENQDSKLERINELLAIGDRHSRDAIENLKVALVEYQKKEDSTGVANTLIEIGKVYAGLAQRHFWEAGTIDGRLFPPPPPSPSSLSSTPVKVQK